MSRSAQPIRPVVVVVGDVLWILGEPYLVRRQLKKGTLKIKKVTPEMLDKDEELVQKLVVTGGGNLVMARED